MATLNIHKTAPSVQITAADSIVTVDYASVVLASKLATDAFEKAKNGGDQSEAIKDLAEAVNELAGTLTEIIRGIDHGNIAIANYPVAGAHLER